MFKYFFSLLFLYSFSVVSHLPYAHAKTDKHQVLEEFAESFIKSQLFSDENERVSIEVTKIDRRITVSQCEGNMTAVLVGNKSLQRSATVRIRCDNTDNWQIHIPVKIIRLVPVVVSNRPLSKGSLLTKNNTKIEYMNRVLLRSGYISDLVFVNRARLKRQLSSGQMISTRDICLVCKGESVTITSSVGNLTVKTAGVALSNGVLGDKINVRNTKSKRIVSGIVQAAGTIQINY
ncbi:flagellar basal body P-ring formation chaperone FlgA [Moritella sp. F3]|uniref:flagellar basal body P-ring formation chaperone FlgA n=1 Tax=Moritella sp. F3 TaxID=2718882 RepID=UPI0018E1763F|nr:flagellar basal body P-ring formation chaperone FlgA [Moritella sp. F3]GIC76615.1 flagellar basal body P-ring biosynthesis protein FlgA [Moritella sp. F1]GIC81632.1 flagellar basal body P-ring biosynthesis protein FlgA [Moritella sp. F3]